jgi:SAM-dependent methyltransferase
MLAVRAIGLRLAGARVKVAVLRMLSNKVHQVHEIAQSGFSDDNVDKYNRGRPGYDSQSLGMVNELLEGSWDPNDPLRRIVELGAGTGKFTRDFLTKYPKYRCNYLATEPSSAFRQSLVASLGTEDNFRAMEGYGESVDVPSHSVSGVLIAQAFHWMDNDQTLREMHRILKPNAPIICVWNAQSRSVPWQAVLEFNIISPHYPPDTPRQQDYKWREVFLNPEKNAAARELYQSAGGGEQRQGQGSFSIAERAFTRSITSTAQTIVDRALSVSVVARLPAAEQAVVERQIRELLRTHPDTRHVTDDRYRVDILTELAWVFTKP